MNGNNQLWSYFPNSNLLKQNYLDSIHLVSGSNTLIWIPLLNLGRRYLVQWFTKVLSDTVDHNEDHDDNVKMFLKW